MKSKKRLTFFSSFLLSALLTSASLSFAQETTLSCRRANACLKLGELDMGIKEAENGLIQDPNNCNLQNVYIKLLAAAGKENESIEAWKKYESFFTEEALKRELLEDVCWGIIRKGFDSSQLLSRIITLVGSTMTQDAYSVALIENALNDSNWVMRKLGLQLSCYLMDIDLQKKTLKLLKDDPNWEVRVEAIRAVSAMQVATAEPILNEILNKQNTLDAIEKAAIIESLVMIKEKATVEEINNLSNANRAGFRQLAAALAAHSESIENLPTLYKLSSDSNSDVKILALSALASLKNLEGINLSDMESKTKNLLKDMDYKVCITASYLHVLLGSKEGCEILKNYCFHSNLDVRRFAASALAATGYKGIESMKEIVAKSNDPFVKVQLSITLAGLRENLQDSLNNIFIFLNCETSSLMWDDSSHPIFKTLTPTKLRRNPYEDISSPETMDILIRLHLLRMLAIFEYPSTIDLMKQFLKERNFGVTLTVASTLIEEGGNDDLEMIRSLLYDPDLKIRVQAALVLATWSKEKEPILVLQEAYPKVDRDMKIKILEAVGTLGLKESVPFLIDKMQDSYQVIRIIGATALVMCLNH
jgi:HEAT repeat protein